MKKKNLLYAIIAVVVVGGLIWFDAKNRNDAPELIQSPTPTPAAENNDGGSQSADALEGTLLASNDESRGNLMIVNGASAFYIRTARDFSSLIGKEVVVTIDGTLDAFTLVNIEAKLDSNGFIQSN